jgi:cytolysin-activating lysine-acyltransferase
MALWPKKTNSTPDKAAAPVATTPAPPAPSLDGAKAASAPAAAATSASELSDENLKKMAQASKRLSSAFGEIVALLMRTRGYSSMALSELDWLVVPAVVTGQFTLAESQSKSNGVLQPMGVILWAKVSQDIDAQITSQPDKPLRLKPADWVGGDHYWVIEAVGERRVVEALLGRMAETVWAGKNVKVRVRNKDGKLVVGELSRSAKTSSATAT